MNKNLFHRTFNSQRLRIGCTVVNMLASNVKGYQVRIHRSKHVYLNLHTFLQLENSEASPYLFNSNSTAVDDYFWTANTKYRHQAVQNIIIL